MLQVQREIKAKCFPLKFRRYIILGGLGGTGDENGEGKLRWGEDEPNKQVQLATGCFRTFGPSFILYSSAFTRFLLQQKHIQQRKESAINILEDSIRGQCVSHVLRSSVSGSIPGRDRRNSNAVIPSNKF